MNTPQEQHPPSKALAPHERLSAQCSTPSPLGTITLAATEKGLAGAWFDDQKHHPGALLASVQPQHPWLALAAHELQAYFLGQLQRFTVPLDARGTAFQQQVWAALLALPHGTLCTYSHLAKALGRPKAARAVGAAVGRNPLGIIVPCHRVVGQDGALTGYAGGLHRKQALLQLEGALGAGPAGTGTGTDTASAQPQGAFKAQRTLAFGGAQQP